MYSVKKIIYSILALAIIGGMLYGSTQIDQGRVISMTSSMGWLGPALILILFICSHIFAQFSSIPVALIAIKLYGYGDMLLIFYFASLVSATVNFWIARKYGKRLIAWLVGPENLHKIEDISAMNERTLLVTSRVFGYYWFDVMSYALGLTNIGFAKYFLYTAVLTIIPASMQYFIFRDLDFDSLAGLLIYIGSIALLAAVFIRIFYKMLKTR